MPKSMPMSEHRLAHGSGGPEFFKSSETTAG